MHITNRSVLILVAAVVVLVLAFYVWPTPWMYQSGGILVGEQIVPLQTRTSRLSGRIQALTIEGWVSPTPMPVAPVTPPVTPPPLPEPMADTDEGD